MRSKAAKTTSSFMCEVAERDKWKAVANAKQLSLSQWIREELNKAVAQESQQKQAA